jgi:hypothetical protein
MPKRIYIETTIPSFYFEARSAPDIDHIRRVNAMLGLFVPALVTPLELLGDDDADES